LDENQAHFLIQSRLQPGEQLIWSGSPPPLSAAWNGPLLRLPLALFFLGFAIFWTWAASHAAAKNGSSPAQFFPLFGLLFVGVGLYQFLSALRAVAGCWSTAYGVTERRVIIAIGQNGPTQSIGPALLNRMERSGGLDFGTLNFDSGLQYGRYGWNWYWAWNWKPQPAFVQIRDPAKVEALIYTHLLNRKREGAAI
jgi:hypothetical protein